MAQPRLFLFLFLFLFLGFDGVNAQNVKQKLEIPHADESTDGDSARKENFPIHVTDKLLQRPEGKEALRSLKERQQRISRGAEVQSFHTPSHSVGDQHTFKVNNFDTGEYDEVEFELVAVGDLSEIWVETEELDPEKVTPEVIDVMMTALEEETPERSHDPGRGIIEIEQELFGIPPDVDGSGKVKVMLVNIQDG
ncbi:MAG: hypothetical protein WDZ53_03270, partial [Balneolales bacterium]